MTTTPTPIDQDESWVIECADPEVGIHSDSIVHECAENADAEQASADVTMRDRDDNDVDVTTTFTCPACHARSAFTEVHPRSWFE
jgi:hypothetical protein